MLRVSRALIASAVVLAVSLPAAAFGQDAYTKSAQAQFNMIKGNLSKTATKVPEELYSFKPTPEVRSLGELVGHVADANFMICGIAAGEKPPQGGFEKNAKTKAALEKALNDSIAYCDKVIAGLNDAKGVENVQFFFGPTPKLSVIYFNIAHANEHYGNLVTYMRLKGIVPPSSEPSTR